MARDYEREAYADHERGLAIQAWFKARVANIHSHISAADVLSRNGVSLRKSGGQEEQISCPFHGADKRPSARYFPEHGDSLSHVWCFVCHKRWDAVGLWKQFTNETKFSTLLFTLEKAFGITAPEYNIAPSHEDEYDPLKEEVERLLEACENRLREYKGSFDMPAHLKVGSILDQIRFSLDRGAVTLVDGRDRLQQVLAKIGQKVRAEKTPATER